MKEEEGARAMAGKTARPDKPLLRALAGESLERPPWWLMRQAGRYLPEYRALREKPGFHYIVPHAGKWPPRQRCSRSAASAWMRRSCFRTFFWYRGPWAAICRSRAWPPLEPLSRSGDLRPSDIAMLAPVGEASAPGSSRVAGSDGADRVCRGAVDGGDLYG